MSVHIYAYVEGRIEIDNKMEWVDLNYFHRSTGEYGNKGELEQISPCGSGSWLAGVLSNIPWNTEERGLPQDCCKYTYEEYDRTKEYAYGHHWITLKDLLEFPVGKLEDEERDMLIPIIDNLKDRAREILWWFDDTVERRASDLRMIFWFAR